MRFLSEDKGTLSQVPLPISRLSYPEDLSLNLYHVR